MKTWKALSIDRWELVDLPPESEPNNWIARCLLITLAASGIVSPRLIVIHTLELQVPVLQPRDTANRFPDLAILREEHLELIHKRLTITLDMSPPRLIAEVISPGKTNRDRDFINGRNMPSWESLNIGSLTLKPKP